MAVLFWIKWLYMHCFLIPQNLNFFCDFWKTTQPIFVKINTSLLQAKKVSQKIWETFVIFGKTSHSKQYPISPQSGHPAEAPNLCDIIG
jgi:hypothetical protein